MSSKMIYIVIGVALILSAAFYLSNDDKFYELTVRKSIDANAEQVWHVLAEEFGNIHQYSEHVSAVELVDQNAKPGLGCVRVCSLEDGGFMKEEITIWKPLEEIQIEIKDSSMPMVPGTNVHFKIENKEDGVVEVIATGRYRLKYVGKLSPLIAETELTNLIEYLIDIAKEAAEGQVES